MDAINKNIRFLREQAGWTQKELAAKLDVKQPVIGAYEEFRSLPPIPVIIKISDLFKIDIDTLLRTDLAKGSKKSRDEVKYHKGKDILAITVNSSNKENIELVNQKASAGYMNGYNDVEYVKELPKIDLPFLSKNNTYRAFEIKGDSMLPIPSKSIVIGQYVSNLSEIIDGEVYVILTKDEGVVFKRVYSFLKESNGMLLISDNPLYKPYFVHFNDVIEVWKKTKIIIDGIESSQTVTGNDIASFALNIHRELTKIK